MGCILSLGLMVAPAATVYLLTNNARALFWGGGVIGAVGSVAAYVFSPKYGLFSRR